MKKKLSLKIVSVAVAVMLVFSPLKAEAVGFKNWWRQEATKVQKAIAIIGGILCTAYVIGVGIYFNFNPLQYLRFPPQQDPQYHQTYLDQQAQQTQQAYFAKLGEQDPQYQQDPQDPQVQQYQQTRQAHFARQLQQTRQDLQVQQVQQAQQTRQAYLAQMAQMDHQAQMAQLAQQDKYYWEAQRIKLTSNTPQEFQAYIVQQMHP